MNPFAKIFESSKYGQIMAMKSRNVDLCPTIEFHYNLNQDTPDGPYQHIVAWGDSGTEFVMRDLFFEELTIERAEAAIDEVEENDDEKTMLFPMYYAELCSYGCLFDKCNSKQDMAARLYEIADKMAELVEENVYFERDMFGRLPNDPGFYTFDPEVAKRLGMELQEKVTEQTRNEFMKGVVS